MRSPFGHVLVAIRENQLRATFQGYPVERYKLVGFVISAVVTGLAGALLGFQTLPRLGRGRLGAVLRRAPGDGGDRRHAPHPRAGARRRCSTSCSASCSRSGPRTGCSGSASCSSASCSISPGGLVGIWAKLHAALASAAGRSRRDEPAQDLRGPRRCRRSCGRSRRRAAVLRGRGRLEEASAASGPSRMRASPSRRAKSMR